MYIFLSYGKYCILLAVILITCDYDFLVYYM